MDTTFFRLYGSTLKQLYTTRLAFHLWSDVVEMTFFLITSTRTSNGNFSQFSHPEAVHYSCTLEDNEKICRNCFNVAET